MALRPIPVMAAALFLLAGCASQPQGTGSSSTSTATITTVPASPAHTNTQGAEVSQSAELAWTAAMDGCVFSDRPQAPLDGAYDMSYGPQAKGLLYDSARVDHATRGLHYNATITFDRAGTGVVLLFWNGTVGAGGAIVATEVASNGLQTPQTLVGGVVPPGADMVSVSSCGAGGGHAHYKATN